MNPAVVIDYIIEDLGVDEGALKNTLTLLGRGATVPFIARYRKEQTGSLDEVQIRAIGEKFAYYAELEARKETVLTSIGAQGRLTDALRAKITACRQKHLLEDLYLPYKPKQRTRATAAREKGLGPLADLILTEQPVTGDRDALIARFVDPAKGVPSAEAALTEALEIVIEMIAEHAETRAALRDLFRTKGVLISKVRHELAGTKTKFEAYYAFSELLAKVPSHRFLAIRRGTKEEVLTWEIDVPGAEALRLIELKMVRQPRSIFVKDLLRAIAVSYDRTIKTSIEVEVFRLKFDEADAEAITVFAKNLRNLLLAAPAGQKVIMGVDPGLRTGCKVAVIDRNGTFREYRQLYVTDSDRHRASAERDLVEMARKHGVELIAIGNGTASKEASAFVQGVIARNGLAARAVMVSEAGASVYSASDAARREFPDLDITVKGAISIARRLQDPLAELVKIDPKAIGVGQYQHDVNQMQLKRSLDATVESCVNHVGVELNTASAELLAYVSGIGPYMAKSVIAYRAAQGAFRSKRELLKVPGLGPRTFEQCAGFLKIREGDDPLDNSTIHPESFGIVERMAADLGVAPSRLLGAEELVARLDPSRYCTETAGLPTVTYILNELQKPGRDPRKAFTSAAFSQTINDIADLSIGAIMEGVVTNVTNFGAFVDIGIHQDGLMHISRMSDRYVRDPHEVVAVGDRVKVKVLSVDKVLKRIALAMSAKVADEEEACL